jgi:hypothetical protein
MPAAAPSAVAGLGRSRNRGVLTRSRHEEDNMGLGDMVNKAKEAMGQHPDQVDKGMDKAGEFVDEKTGGKYSDQINQGKDKLRQQFGGGQQDQPQDQPPQ